MNNLHNLEQRDRESPVLSGLVFCVLACDPMRRGTPVWQLLESRRSRIAAHRCPATREIQDPRTTGLHAAPEVQASASYRSTLRLQKGQQVGIDRVCLGGWHAMREALVGL